MEKVLITGGCSFSDCSWKIYKPWPIHLANLLTEYRAIHTGAGSQGNGLISRKIIYEVQDILKKGTDPKNILVGIMWSGPSRFDIFNDSQPAGYDNLRKSDIDVLENPIRFVRENPHKEWYIFNWNWKNDFNSAWYRYYQNPIMDQILTIENMLRVQWFLKSLGIKYFMTCYTSKVFDRHAINHPEVKYLYEMLDFDQFLPVSGEYEWCEENFSSKSLDTHPSSKQHEAFVDKVIWPWLMSKNLIL